MITNVPMKTLNEMDFNKWVEYKLKDFRRCLPPMPAKPWIESELSSYYPSYFNGGNFTIIVEKTKGRVTILNTETGHLGIAKKNSVDDWNVKTGLAIAWAKYKKEEVPSLMKSVLSSTLTYGMKYLLNETVVTFIGWFPKSTNLGIVVDENGRLLTVPVPRTVELV